METVTQHAKRVGWFALDTVLPPRCLGCGAIVADQGALCPACWREVTFLAPPRCAVCGFPFEAAPAEDTRCGACLAAPPPYDRARAALAYDAASRPLVTRFKHADRLDAAPAFAAWMARAAADLPRPSVIAPVPLHRRRLFRRRYNQAAVLARELGPRLGGTVVPDLLVRRRDTPSQGAFSPAGRARNVAGAFAVHPRRAGWADRTRVLLVDDVFTTGVTLEACARRLRAAGAAGVDAVTLARVPQPRPR